MNGGAKEVPPYLRKGIRQAGMCTFPFAAACERKKLAKRVSYRSVFWKLTILQSIKHNDSGEI